MLIELFSDCDNPGFFFFYPFSNKFDTVHPHWRYSVWILRKKLKIENKWGNYNDFEKFPHCIFYLLIFFWIKIDWKDKNRSYLVILFYVPWNLVVLAAKCNCCCFFFFSFCFVLFIILDYSLKKQTNVNNNSFNFFLFNSFLLYIWSEKFLIFVGYLYSSLSEDFFQHFKSSDNLFQRHWEYRGKLEFDSMPNILIEHSRLLL